MHTAVFKKRIDLSMHNREDDRLVPANTCRVCRIQPRNNTVHVGPRDQSDEPGIYTYIQLYCCVRILSCCVVVTIVFSCDFGIGAFVTSLSF